MVGLEQTIRDNIRCFRRQYSFLMETEGYPLHISLLFCCFQISLINDIIFKLQYHQMYKVNSQHTQQNAWKDLILPLKYSLWLSLLLEIVKGKKTHKCSSVQFSSVTQSCPTLCDPMNRSTPGLPVHHQLPEFTQTHVHRVSDAIQPSHPLSSPSPPAHNPSQHQSLFQWVNSSHEVAKVLEFQL